MGLFDAVGDSSAAIDAVISKVREGVACALLLETSGTDPDCVVVGLLLALRELSCVADPCLLQGCLRLDSQSTAMKMFVQFLEEDEDEESDDEDKSKMLLQPREG